MNHNANTNFANADTILGQHSIVVPIIRAWTGTAKLGRDDLVTPDALPPDHLATAGSIRLVPPTELSFVKSIKGKIWHRVRAFGLPLEGMGTLVQDAQLDDVEKFLQHMQAQWNTQVNSFISGITRGTVLTEWLAANPEWSNVIRSKLPANLESLRDRFSFRWQTYHVVPADEEKAQELAEEIHISAFERLVDELKDMTDKAFANETPAKDGLPRRVLSLFSTMRARCDALALMNPDAAVFSRVLTQMQGLIASAQASPADQLVLARSLLQSVTDPDSAYQLVEASRDANAAATALTHRLNVARDEIEAEREEYMERVQRIIDENTPKPEPMPALAEDMDDIDGLSDDDIDELTVSPASAPAPEPTPEPEPVSVPTPEPVSVLEPAPAPVQSVDDLDALMDLLD